MAHTPLDVAQQFTRSIILDSVEISEPAAVYSALMFILAALWGRLIASRVGSTREPPAA